MKIKSVLLLNFPIIKRCGSAGTIKRQKDRFLGTDSFKRYRLDGDRSPGITNDIDGSQSFDGIRYAGKNSFYFKITPDNLDQVRRNVTEAKVKFPEKQAELLKLLDEMGEMIIRLLLSIN